MREVTRGKKVNEKVGKKEKGMQEKEKRTGREKNGRVGLGGEKYDKEKERPGTINNWKIKNNLFQHRTAK